MAVVNKDQMYREQIVDVARRLTKAGLVGTFEGNISIIDRKAGRVYITPSGQSKETLTEDMIIVVDTKGNYISRKKGLKSSSETIMHLAMYRFRKDITGCIHCHAPFSTAFAVNGEPIKTRSIAEVEIMFGGEVPVLPFGEPGTEDLVAGYKNHKDKDVVLLRNHGMLAVGADLWGAYSNTMTVEMIAKTLYYSRTMGQNVEIPGEEYAKLSQWKSKQAKRN